MSDIKVIGIDPAPSKESTIFYYKNGTINFERYNYVDLKKYLDELKNQAEKVLICWDAPLSFNLPKDKNNKIASLYKRKIEYFFSRKIGFKVTSTIPVRAFADLSHWTISQFTLGYPMLREYKETQHFNLIFNKESINMSVTEVHPALAIWFWCKENGVIMNNYKSKKDKNQIIELIDKLIDIKILNKEIKEEISKQPKEFQADSLDAYIAWKLGNDWINAETTNNKVCILGNEETGSFLLPYDVEIFEKFENFQVK